MPNASKQSSRFLGGMSSDAVGVLAGCISSECDWVRSSSGLKVAFDLDVDGNDATSQAVYEGLQVSASYR